MLGTWPGTIWLQSLDVGGGAHPEDPDWTSRFFRYESGAWSKVVVEHNKTYHAVWQQATGCLVGIRGPNIVNYASRRAVDCPSRRVPIRALRDPTKAYSIRLGAAAPSGDAYLIEESSDVTPGFRIERLSATDPPVSSIFTLPLPKEVESGEKKLDENATRILLARSATEAYFHTTFNKAPLLFRFDGQAWSKLETPPATDLMALTVTGDGALLIAASGSGTDQEHIALWTRLPGQLWEKHSGAIQGHPEARDCHPYQAWARSLDDVWIACGKKGKHVVLHTAETKSVWTPKE